MEVVPGVGHMLHEVRISSSSHLQIDAEATYNYPFVIQDNPTRLAAILVEFWKRNDRVIEGIKKVGEL